MCKRGSYAEYEIYLSKFVANVEVNCKGRSAHKKFPLFIYALPLALEWQQHRNESNTMYL